MLTTTIPTESEVGRLLSTTTDRPEHVEKIVRIMGEVLLYGYRGFDYTDEVDEAILPQLFTSLP